MDRVTEGRVHADSGQVICRFKQEEMIEVRDVLTGETVAEFAGINALWHPSGSSIYVKDGTEIRHMEVETGKRLSGFSVPAGHWWQASNSVSADGQFIVSRKTGGKHIYLWDSNSGTEHGTVPLDANSDKIFWSPQTSTFAIPKYQRVDIYDARTCKKLVTIQDDTLTKSVQVRWSPDGNRIAIIRSGVIHLWDAHSGNRIHRLVGHSEYRWIHDVAWSPDSRMLASGGHDQLVKVWDAETGREIHSLDAHTSTVGRVAFSPDGTRLVSHDHGGIIRLWDPMTGDELLTLADTASGSSSSIVRNLVWVDDGRSVLAMVGNLSGQADGPTLVVLGASRGYEMASSGELDANVARREFLRGIKLAKSLRVEDSETAFQRAEDLVGIQAWARADRARNFAIRGRINEALSDFELASSAPDSTPQSRNEYAWLLANHPEEKKREPERAERIARGLVTEWPNQGQFWVTLSMALMRQERWQETLSTLDKADDHLVVGHAKMHWMRAICLFHDGKPEDAIQSFAEGNESWNYEEGYDSGLTYDCESLQSEVRQLLGDAATQ